MSDERKITAGTSIRRIAYAATGAAMVLFGAIVSALPFLLFSKEAPADLLLMPVTYLGLAPIGYGLLLIRWSR